MKKQKRKPPVLVVYDTQTNRYQRFEGKTRTIHVQADHPLTAPMIEQLRVDPESLISPEDGGEN